MYLKVTLLKEDESAGYAINRSELPTSYPTHAHDPAFWEALGRAVAAFGFLEEVLLKAIFVYTATTPYDQSEVEAMYEAWVKKMTRSLSDTLHGLIDTYGKAVRDNPEADLVGFDDLLVDLKNACKIRNAICHGSWRTPDPEGLSVPFYVNRQSEIFDTPVGIAFLGQCLRATTDLACAVIDSVTHMGWQFPGSTGPGCSLATDAGQSGVGV